MVSLRRTLITLIAAGLVSAGVITAANEWAEQIQAQNVSQAMAGKDVVADILPPPLYLIELRLVLGMAVDGTMPLAQAQSEQARLVKEYQDRVTYWQANPPHGLERLLLGEQDVHARKFMAASSLVLDALKSQDPAAAKQALLEAHNHYASHRKAVDTTVQAATAFATTSMQQYGATSQKSQWFAMGLFGVMAVALSLFGRQVLRTIWRATGGEPAEVARIANAVALGDLSVKVHVRPGDETSIMAAMARMCERLSTVVTAVRKSSDEIATGSQQIAGSNMDLSVRTEQQAANLEQTASAMEEFNGTVQTTADTAVQARDLAQHASHVALHGADVMGQVVSTMDDISMSSRKIADITSVIDGIAFQTNILALNAAVEAARAGEQGRGFAVVASEVRSLAQRSSTAAKEINALINSSVTKVEAGSSLVTNAGEAMNNIVTQVQKVSDLIHEISAASKEQTQGIQLVSEAVNQLDGATQQNAAMVEESAAAASNLSDQARELVRQVSTFKL